jgi:polyhydroxyalkanoate synthesis repressor PhaR
MKIIKKYKNRRLYDTDASQYITFEDLKQFINDGIEFEIIDSKSKEDITSATLLQLLVESQDKQSQMLPKQLLITLIKYSDHPVHQYINKVLIDAMNLYNQQHPLDDMKDIFSNISNQTQNLFEQWQSIFTSQTNKKDDEEK